MRNLLLPLAALMLLFATSAAAVPENWRDEYMKHRDPMAARAIWDFDSAVARLNVVLLQMQQEGQLTPDAMHRIQAEVEKIEYDYVQTHFNYGPSVISNYIGPQTGAGYDGMYTNAVPLAVPQKPSETMPQPVPPKAPFKEPKK